jgi:hypothetical protein
MLTSPADNVDEWTVQARCHREQKPVRQTWHTCVWDSELTNEACRSDREADHDERRALLYFVRPKCEYDCHDHGEHIYGYRKELSIG